MITLETNSKLSVLHVIVGASDHEPACAEHRLVGTEWGKRLFVPCNYAATETMLLETLDGSVRVDMVLLTPTESSSAMELVLHLSKLAKEREILSIVAAESKDWNPAEYLQEHNLSMEKLLAHMDSLLLVPMDQCQEKDFYHSIDDFLSFTRMLVNEEGFINLDFQDISAVLKDTGLACFVSRIVEGNNSEERLQKMSVHRLVSPNILATAKRSLIEMKGCMDIGLEDVDGTVAQVQQHLPSDALVVFGAAFDDSLENEIQVCALVSDFNIGYYAGDFSGYQMGRSVREQSVEN